MSTDESSKLYIFMQNEFAQLNEKLDSKAHQKDMDRVLVILDDLAQKIGHKLPA